MGRGAAEFLATAAGYRQSGGMRLCDAICANCHLRNLSYKDETRLSQWREIFAGIIQGYSELSPLSADELDSIPVLFLFDEVLFTAFFFSIGQPEVAKSCIEMTKWVHKNISSLLSQYMEGLQ